MTQNDDNGSALDPRTAHDRIREAFLDPLDRPPEQPADPRTVFSLYGGGEPETMENPFRKDHAEREQMRRVEALLFASPRPLDEEAISERVPGADVPAICARLVAEYQHRGINLRHVAGAWQFVTAQDVAGVLVEQRTQTRKLSRAALETLAIIAYHQPCSRADIEEVRGVAVAKGSLDQLMELGWVGLRGRREAPGRPVLYGTTPAFLEHFGLGTLTHLPGLQDLKAAGLLDARLPPGFEVPRPTDTEGEADDEEPGNAAENPDFAVDFDEEDAEGTNWNDDSET